MAKIRVPRLSTKGTINISKRTGNAVDVRLTSQGGDTMVIYPTIARLDFYEEITEVNQGQEFSLTLIAENASYFDGKTVTLSSDSNINGTMEVQSTGNTANFPGLSIDTAGEHTITVYSSGLAPISITITVNEIESPSGKYLSIGVDRTTFNVDETFTITATVHNEIDDQVDTTFDGDVTLTPDPANLAGTLIEAAVSGVASFSVSIDDALDVEITASADDVTSDVITISAVDTMESIQLISFPASAIVGEVFTFEAWAINQEGQLYTNFTGDVVLTKVSGDGTLGGTTTVAAIGGVATFDDNTLSADGVHVLRVTGNSLTDDGSITIDNKNIVLASDETVYDIGEVFTVTATIRDGAVTDADNTSDVTIEIVSGTGTLGGTLTVAAVDGVATFTDLELDAGGAFTLSASAADCDAGTLGIAINEEPPSLELSTIATTVEGNTISAFTVTAKDSGGETETSFQGWIEIEILSGTGTLSGTTTKKAVNGVATFNDISIDTDGEFVIGASLPEKVLDASYDTSATVGQDLYTFDQRGQSYTPVNSGDLHSIELALFDQGTADGPLVVKTYAVSTDNPTGAALATSAEVDTDTVPSNPGTPGASNWIAFTFSSGSVTADTKIAIVADYTGKTGGTGLRWYTAGDGSGYTGGRRSYFNGTVWATLTSDDHLFRVYLDNPGTYESATGAVTITAQQVDVYEDAAFVGWVMDSIAEDYFSDATLIKVTNLNPTGTGSLYAALRTTGKRKIVFERGGVIDMSSITAHGLPGKVDIASGDVYIIGQTAPAPGIHVIKCMLDVYNANNVFIQHTSWYGSTVANTDAIAPRGDYIVLDHVSTYYGLDENIGPFPYDAVRLGSNVPHHITVSNSIIADSTYTPGGNIAASKGLMCPDKGRYFAFFGNLLINNYYRNPMLKADVQCAIVNNYIYNPGQSAINHAYVSSEWSAAVPPDSLISVVGNYVQCGGDAITGLRIYGGNTTAQGYRGQIYISDNLGFYQNGSAMPQYSTALNDMIVGSAPIWHTSLNTKVAASALQDYIVTNVGARPWDRSTKDALKITQMLSGGTQGEVIDTTGISYPSLSATQRTFDASKWNTNVLPAVATDQSVYN